MNIENAKQILLGIGITTFLLIIFLLFGKFHVVIFAVLIGLSYKLTDSYIFTWIQSENSLKCWPNLIVFFEAYKDPKEEIRRKQLATSTYIQKNPWIHLMISKRIDDAIDEFCCLCLRDHIYPWLSIITHDDSLAYEVKHAFRYLLATVLRRIQQIDLNNFVVKRLLPLIFQTCDRYIDARRKYSTDNPEEFLRQMYKDNLHITMYNRRREFQYLRELVTDLMSIITPKFLSDCQVSRHFLRELFVCQILTTGIDTLCHPQTLNRLLHLYFTTVKQDRSSHPSIPNVEILSHFCAMNGEIHKNQLALELTDVMYEKELMNQFSRTLDRHGSLSLLSIYLTLSDVLNDIPLAADILVRKKISQRLKHLDQRYFNSNNPQAYMIISNPYNEQDTLIDEMKNFIYHQLEQSLNEINPNKSFDVQETFALLSKFHCKIYELIEEKYQRVFLNSDEHFLYICGQRMDAPNYGNSKQNFDDIDLEFVHIEEIRNVQDNTEKQNVLTGYRTTSYQVMQENDDAHLKCPDDTTSISSASSMDERDLNTWRIRIDHVEEVRENVNSTAKYAVFIVDIQRPDPNNDNSTVNEDERPHEIVARRYQDFYLLEQKLTEFHGIFYDARLPARRSGAAARNLEYLELVKEEFEHFLKHLASKPTLRNSELLYNFLTQPDEFTLPNGEIILTKMFKVVPRAFHIEKGQALEPFLISLLNYIEPPKAKASLSSPVFDDILAKKLESSIYGNNANMNESFLPAEILNNQPEEPDSTFDHLAFLAKGIFPDASYLSYLLNFLRVPMKNTVDTFICNYIENKVDDVLHDEENIINAIHALRDTIFPNDTKVSRSTDAINFDDVIASAEEFMPTLIKHVIGRMNIQHSLRTILQHFQEPLLNKQLFYVILDEFIFALFPELQVHSETSRTNSMTI